MSRLSIPRQLEREILLEAGHRCAIPTCRQHPVEIAHIVSWVKVKEHSFENLIALCPTCHTRFDRGEIDLPSMRRYKANLGLLISRYGDLERRVLSLFAEQPDKSQIKLPGGTQIFVMYLVKDGFLKHIGYSARRNEDEFPNYDLYQLTPEGQDFVQKWITNQPLE
jgi:hypothetical protein